MPEFCVKEILENEKSSENTDKEDESQPSEETLAL
jgi:hypothetical protein